MVSPAFLTIAVGHGKQASLRVSYPKVPWLPGPGSPLPSGWPCVFSACVQEVKLHLALWGMEMETRNKTHV